MYVIQSNAVSFYAKSLLPCHSQFFFSHRDRAVDAKYLLLNQFTRMNCSFICPPPPGTGISLQTACKREVWGTASRGPYHWGGGWGGATGPGTGNIYIYIYIHSIGYTIASTIADTISYSYHGFLQLS